MIEKEIFIKSNKYLIEIAPGEFVDLKNILNENERLKDELRNKPDTKVTLEDENGKKFMLIQTERIDMQKELNDSIQKLLEENQKLRLAKDKATQYYLKELSTLNADNLPMDEVAIKMFNILEGNIK